MFMQIRKGMSEDNGQQYYALVSDLSLHYQGCFLVCVLSCRLLVSHCFGIITEKLDCKLLINFNPVQVNMAETDITRMSSDYADNELELFRKTVSKFLGEKAYKASHYRHLH